MPNSRRKRPMPRTIQKVARADSKIPRHRQQGAGSTRLSNGYQVGHLRPDSYSLPYRPCPGVGEVRWERPLRRGPIVEAGRTSYRKHGPRSPRAESLFEGTRMSRTTQKGWYSQIERRNGTRLPKLGYLGGSSEIRKNDARVQFRNTEAK
jgi:hypothetical protein